MKNSTYLTQQPFFLLLEGIDGSGKSTAAGLLHQHLEKIGLDSIILTEPTGGPFGKETRKVMSAEEPDNERLLKLFIKDRIEDVSMNINPALEAGRIVILDRYYYSNAAYQASNNHEVEAIVEMNRSNNIPEPDRIYYLELSPEDAIERIQKRTLETAKECFDDLDRLKSIAARYDYILPLDTVRINACLKPEEIVEAIITDLSLNFKQAV